MGLVVLHWKHLKDSISSNSDNGATIDCVMEGVLHMDTLLDKKWDWFRALFNPGCQAHVQVAITNAFAKQTKNWISLGQASSGAVEYKFPADTRGKFLFWKITEASKNARMHFFGFEFDATIISR